MTQRLKYRKTLLSQFFEFLKRTLHFLWGTRRIRISQRTDAILALVVGCIGGMILVAFGIAAIDGKLDKFGLLAGLLVGGLLALMVLLFLVFLAMSLLWRWTTGRNARFFKVEAKENNLVLQCPPDEAARRCQAALLQLPQGCEVVPEDCTPGKIVAKTQVSEESFGETIVINLTPDADGTTRVDIHSAPSMAATVFDWGINAENVRTIVGDLRSTETPGTARNITNDEPMGKWDRLPIWILSLSGGYAVILILLAYFWPVGLFYWSEFLDWLPFNPNRLLPGSCFASTQYAELFIVRSLNIIIVPIIPAYIAYRTACYLRGQNRIRPIEIFLSGAALLLFPVMVLTVCQSPIAEHGWPRLINSLRKYSLGNLVIVAFYLSMANLSAYLPAAILARLFKRKVTGPEPSARAD